MRQIDILYDQTSSLAHSIFGYYRLDMSNVDPTELPGIRVIAVHDETSNDSKALVLYESSAKACRREFAP